MFERFTNRARRVVVLSQEEARLLSHNYIGTEHVLLGLLGVPDTIAGKVLASFGFTRDSVRAEVEERIGRGKKAPGGHIPFTPRAKKTLELSLREALSLKHNYIGTEHILLGLISEGEGVAAQIMRDQADLADIRAAVVSAVPAGDPAGDPEGAEETSTVLRWLRQRLSGRQAGAPARDVVPAPSGSPAVEAALRQAAELAGEKPVGSHHLLLAALADANSAASAALTSLGVDMDELRERLRSAQVTGTSDEQPEQAGRRQMSIQVSDEALTIALTDPVIVAAGKEALLVVKTRAAAAAAAAARSAAEESADEPTTGQPTTGEQATGTEGAGKAGEAGAPPGGEAGEASVTGTVIRGDLPEASGLADVWLALRKALNEIVDPTERTRRTVRARRLREPGELMGGAGPASTAEEGEPREGEVTGS